MEWIPIDERMPEKDETLGSSEEVLVTTDSGYVCTLNHRSIKRWNDNKIHPSNFPTVITHWMPIPKPPALLQPDPEEVSS